MVEFCSMSDNDQTFMEFTSIANEISNLSKRLADCQEEKDILSEERSRLRTGTALLQERIHSLEDQYSNAEIRWEEKLAEERARSKELTSRLEREKHLELENMDYKYQVLQKEVQALRKEKEQQDNAVDDTQTQLAKLQDEFDDAKSLNDQLEKEKRELRSEFDNFRREATADLYEREELLESLTKQTDELRQQRSGRPRHGSMTDQILNLEEEVERIRSDNKSLRSLNEELRAQLLHESVERGQMLLADGPSLAAELNGLNSDEVRESLNKENIELMNALRDQEMCNQKLRSYIDNILSRVIEIHPELLEIGRESPSASSASKQATWVNNSHHKGPMSFFRKHVSSLLRQTFSNTKSPDEEDEFIEQYDQNGHPVDYGDNSVIYERILNGKNGRKVDVPEIYSGKTGLDLPVIHLDKFSHSIRSAFSGPDGGLTNVQQMRQQPIVKMANLDDELSLSMGSEDEFEQCEQRQNGRRSNRRDPLLNGSLESLGFCNDDLAQCSRTIDQLDWDDADNERACGLSMSLYEKHPVTGLQAGMPIADVFAVLARQNNAIICLADGVNWGEGSRLAARCSIRGAVDHLNDAIENGLLRTTTEVFHTLLGAFHTAHALILQEGGSLTTLCVALIAPVKNSNSSVLCVCNVGDSLCFVQNDSYGVREVTSASHEIEQHRNMRDAGGALGPVDGRNPQLHNLTCSMTFVEEGDFVFITSDGVSDNFDPVVGKFCLIKRNDSEKENSDESPTIPIKPLHKTKSMPNGVPKQKKRCVAVLPSVDASERQELMLLRMADVISNGIGNLAESYAGYDENDLPTPVENGHKKLPSKNQKNTTSSLCHNLVNFAYHLSNAKRRTLEDPELYRSRTHSKTEERLRRKLIRNMLMEMPGKLDHASVVAFKVGQWDIRERTPRPLISNNSSDTLKQNGNHSPARPNEAPPPVPTSQPPHLFKEPVVELNCLVRISKPTQNVVVHTTVVQANQIETGKVHLCMDIPSELQVEDSSPRLCRRSPYEEQPVAEDQSPQQSPFKKPVLRDRNDENGRQKRKQHKRGSTARHTLGVDVAWLKKLVINRHFSPNNQSDNQKSNAHPSGSTDAVDDLVSPTDLTPSESQNLRSPSANCSPTHRLNAPKPLHHSASTGVPLLPPSQHPNRLHATVSSNSSANFSIRRLKQFIRPSHAAPRYNPNTDTQL